MLAISLLLGAAAPHYSFPKVVTANGYGAVVFTDDRLSDAYPHLYQEYSPGVVTPEVLYDSYFGVTDRSGAGWLTDTRDVSVEDGTGIVVVERAHPDFAVVERTFAPMGMDGFGLAQTIEVTNTGTTDLAPFQVVALLNWHVGGTETVSSASAKEIAESGSDVALTFVAPGASDVSCASVYDTVNAGGRIGGGCNGAGGDMVPAFGWTTPTLAPGESVTFGVHTSEVGHGWVAGREPAEWLEDERAWWEAFHARGALPAGLSADETAVYRQQLAFLKMGQVREDGDAYGQLPASLPLSAPVGDFQHIWNIAWVRDGAYAIVALETAGYHEEAAAALRFLIQPGKTGEWRSYVGDADYAVSVCRLYGDGTEWTDLDADGPNIEYDNFGLFLWALGALVDDDPTLYDDVAPRALDGVADVLVRLVDPNTGLLLPDSSIWERHWNGKQKQFTYSSAWAVEGLRASAAIAETLGDPRADTYRAAAEELDAAIEAHLLDAQGVLAGSREELASGAGYLDLAAVEVYNLDILPAKSDSFAASMDAWERELLVASGNGYHRNDDGSTYDEHEWIVIDLRLAHALRRACRADEAAALEDWVTSQAMLNNRIVPELYDPERGDYAGPAPMLGFGAGAYVLALQTRDVADAACADAPPDEEAPLGVPCGCDARGAAAAPSALALGLLTLLTLRRRRA
jgi:GH15 family glucan-1,4-alpha-glucosidase